MNLFPDDVIRVRLPGFGGSSKALQLASSPEGIAAGAWSFGTGELRLTVSEEMLGQSDIAVDIPASAGIALPSDGVRGDQLTVRIPQTPNPST